MKFLADPSLPGLGDVTGAFLDPVRNILAVGCSFRLLTEPRARAAYGGHDPRYRLALYEQNKSVPEAIFDRLRYPVNDIAFHPSLPVVAIAMGSYDGGWMFEGELVLWNWETGESGRIVDAIPTVVRVAFNAEGDKVLAYVRPWDEGMVEELSSEADPFDVFYEVRATFLPSLEPGLAGADNVKAQLRAQTPVSGKQVNSDGRFNDIPVDSEAAISRHCGTGPIKLRSPIWDVTWLSDQEIGIVHDDCNLEILRSSGEVVRTISGDGHGCEVFGGINPLVHVSNVRESDNWREEVTSTLFRIEDGSLIEEKALVGAHTFSRAVDGRILARRNRSGSPTETKLVDCYFSNGKWRPIDLGRYDVFNHFIRIDDSPYLFFVQDDVPNRNPFKAIRSRAKKWLCVLEPDGTINRLWRILRDDGSDASLAVECAYAVINDGSSEAIVVSGKHHDSNPSKPYAGFIYRKDMKSGKEAWRLNTSASPTVIRYVRGKDIVLGFFLNGDQIVIDATTGRIIRQKRFAPGSIPSIICSCDVSGEKLVIGTMDGRVAVASVGDIAA